MSPEQSDEESTLVKSLLGVAAVAGASVIAESSESMDLGWNGSRPDLSAVIELDNQYRFTVGNDGAAFDYILARGEFGQDALLLGVSVRMDQKVWGACPPWSELELHEGWNVWSNSTRVRYGSGPELQIGGALGVKYTF